MEMFVHASSYGMTIPIIDYEFKYLGGCYVFFRYTPKAPPIQYVFADGLSINNKGRTFVFDNVEIPWIAIPPNNNKDIRYKNLSTKNGLFAELKVEGPLILKGYVDMSFKIVDGKGDEVVSIEKKHIPAKGNIAEALSVEGKLRYIPYRKAS